MVLVVGTVTAVLASDRDHGPADGGRHAVGKWKLVLDDDFDSDVLDTDIWNTCHWWGPDGCTIASNDELQWYQPDQVSVSDGHLMLTADERSVRGSDGRRYEYVSGMVTTGPHEDGRSARVEITYGRVEARVRTPTGTGLWSALWMLPSDTDSRPEIDIMEALGNNPGELLFHLHPMDRDQDSPDHRMNDDSLTRGWHDIAIDWEPGVVRWFVDGTNVWTVEGDMVPDEPMYLVANLAVGGVYPGAPNDDTKFPAQFEIDRVRMWQRPS